MLNAANEVAVHAFLADELPFLGIAEVIEQTLTAMPAGRVGHFSDLYKADAEARERAREFVAVVRA